LVVEVKTDLASLEATLRMLDEKCRLAAGVARKAFGVRATAVARLLVMRDTSTLRRRVAEHASVLDRTLACWSVELRRYIAHASGSMGGIWFLSVNPARVGASKPTGRDRVRRPNPPPGNLHGAD